MGCAPATPALAIERLRHQASHQTPKHGFGQGSPSSPAGRAPGRGVTHASLPVSRQRCYGLRDGVRDALVQLEVGLSVCAHLDNLDAGRLEGGS